MITSAPTNETIQSPIHQPDKALHTQTLTEDKDLNPKQISFVYEYIKTNNGTTSAIHAGYSPRSARSTASTILAKPNVKALVAKLVREAQGEAIATVVQRKEKLTEIMQDKTEKSNTQILAISELNRMEQVYDTSPKVTVPIQINYVEATEENAKRLQAGMMEGKEG